MEKGIRQKIEEWTKTHAVKYHDSSTDISPTKQLEVLSSLFDSLKSEGVTAEEVLPYMQIIASPLAPKDIKSLKKIRKYRLHKDEDLKAILGRWCGASSDNLVASFNEIFYPNGEGGLDGRLIYEWMCRKRNIRPMSGITSAPSDDDIKEHLEAEPIQGLSLKSKKNYKDISIEIEKNDDTLESAMKKYRPFKVNPSNVFPEFPSVSGPDQEALEFFGLSGIPKEKL